jgi:glutamate carboxypeptidase
VTTAHTDQLEVALAALHARGRDMLELARTWVEVNSYTENVRGVNAVGSMLRDAFGLPSLECDEKASQKFGNHLFWSTPAAKEKPAIVLIGHHDTVFPPGHFEEWHEENGRASGPGILDMKGGLAIIHAVLAVLEDVGELASLPIVLASVADEEVGSMDSRPHLESASRGAACALVFESGRTGDLIITRRRGVGGMKFTARGKAAHAGNAHKDGANAIWALAYFIDRAQRLTFYPRGVTVNVGTIKGGTSKNTVPEHAECQLDLRFETIEDSKQIVTAIEQAALEAQREVPGVKIEVEGGVSRMPLVRTPASQHLYEEYAAAQTAAGLGAGETGIVGGGSDANTVSGIGVPAIDGLGPRGDGFHTRNEYVETASFVPKAEALLRFLWGRRMI